MTETFTCDDIALLVEIPGLYDGTAVYLLKDGRLVNRFAHAGGWGGLSARVDEWIARHGDAVRRNNSDLLDASAMTAASTTPCDMTP